jgi:hypothetical protein
VREQLRVEVVEGEAEGADGDAVGAEAGYAELKDKEAYPAELALERLRHQIGGSGEASADDDDLRIEGEYQGGGTDREILDVAADRGSGVVASALLTLLGFRVWPLAARGPNRPISRRRPEGKSAEGGRTWLAPS